MPWTFADKTFHSLDSQENTTQMARERHGSPRFITFITYTRYAYAKSAALIGLWPGEGDTVKNMRGDFDKI